MVTIYGIGSIRSQAPKVTYDETMEKVQRLNGCGLEDVSSTSDESLRYSLVPPEKVLSPRILRAHTNSRNMRSERGEIITLAW